MMADRIEGKWIDTFVQLFQASEVRAGESVAILSETLSCQQNVRLAELALQQMGARPFHIIIPTPAQTVNVAIRSTGSSDALRGQKAALQALAAADVVIDMTIEMLLHAPELFQIIQGGARLLSVSNEHPEVFERIKYDPNWQKRVVLGLEMLGQTKTMRVTSDAGTDLTVRIGNARPIGKVSEIENALDPKLTIPNWMDFIAGFTKHNEAARRTNPPKTFRYADHERGLLDLYNTGVPAGAPALIFFMVEVSSC